MPTKGLANTQCFDLNAIFVCQIALLYRFQQSLDLRIGLNTFIKAPEEL